MDTLEALGDDGTHAEQVGALSGPVARAAGAILGAGQNDGRHAGGFVEHRGVVDWHDLADGRAGSSAGRASSATGPKVLRHAAFGAGGEEVPNADVGKRPADHHAVVAAAAAIAIEIGRL